VDERREEIAKTEALFRDVNERIAEASDRFDAPEAEFMCECSDPACVERIEVPLAEYEEVREEPTQFLLDPQHVKPEVERIVDRRRGYAIVEKFDEVVAHIARQLDPRAEPAA
jgi:hypothetical protein